jgi:acetyl-CoA carboxylase biotin carboxyl carrier protein
MNFELDFIKKLADVVNKNNLSEITLEDGDKAIVIKAEKAGLAQAQAQAPVAPVAKAAPQVEAEEPVAEASKKKGTAITSPMVGAFYASPSPSAKPFVKVGDRIAVGQVVCIIEAMKLMNEIEAEVSGTITEICVEDGQSVEYGQVLMYVE